MFTEPINSNIDPVMARVDAMAGWFQWILGCKMLILFGKVGRTDEKWPLSGGGRGDFGGTCGYSMLLIRHRLLIALGRIADGGGSPAEERCEQSSTASQSSSD
jgi:hypothetical protein